MRNEADGLHTWSPVDGALCGGYERCTLMEDVCHWGWAVRAVTWPRFELAHSASCLKCDLLVPCSYLHACSLLS